MRPWLAAVVVALLVSACSRSPDNTGQGYTAKMQLVLQEAVRQASSPSDKSSLQDGKIFVNIAGLNLDQDVIGVSIPVDGGQRTLVTFTADHFRATAVDVLATEMLRDLAKVRHESRRP